MLKFSTSGPVGRGIPFLRPASYFCGDVGKTDHNPKVLKGIRHFKKTPSTSK